MKVEKLLDVVQIKNPKPEKFSGEKRYYSTGNIDEHDVSENFELVKFENRPSRANVQPIENSVGFAKMKSTAKTLLVTKNYSECIFSTGMNFLLPSENIISKYLYYYLISPYFFDLKDKYSGQGIMGGLSNKDLNLFKIPVPSLREQEKIVERLDDIFCSISESIQIYDSKLENISKLKQSYIDEIFFNYENTADEVVLDDVSTIVGRIGYRGYTKKDLVSEGSGALSLSPSNIKNNEMTYIKNTFISWEKYEESPEIKIHDGDIIFCKTGSTYGKVAIVKDLKYKATLNPQLVVLKNLNIDNEFLFYQLLTSKFKNFIESIVGGTATPTLSQTNLGRAKILNLNKKIQKDLTIKINTFLKKRNLLENNYIQMINLLKELKTSILIKEFNYE